MKRMLIRVTQDHIDTSPSKILQTGLRSKSCPTALAIGEAIQNDDVRVFYKFVNFPWRLLASSLPVRAMRFINRFDKEKPVKPFNFYLMVPA